MKLVNAAASSNEDFRTLKLGVLPTTIISETLKAIATEVAILATVCPTRFTIPAAKSSFVALFLYLATFPKFTAVVSGGKRPIGPETTSSNIKSTPLAKPLLANSSISRGSVVPISK